MGIPATFETQLPWLNTFRGRVGYAFGSILPYVTAGGAFGGVRATDSNHNTELWLRAWWSQ